VDDFFILGLLGLAFFIGGFVKGAIGYGMPLIATPILLFAFTLPQVVLVMVPAIFFSNLIQGFQTRHCWPALRRYWPMIAANCLILVFFGGQILTMVDAHILTISVGLMMAVHAGLSLAPPIRAAEQLFSSVPQRWIILPAGILSGLLGSITTIYGFPSLQAIVSAKLSKDETAFLFSVFLASGHLALWRGMVIHDYTDPQMLKWGLVGSVPMFFALMAGRVVHKRLSVQSFRRFVNLVLLIAGISLVMKSL